MCSLVNDAENRVPSDEPVQTNICHTQFDMKSKMLALKATLADDVNASDIKWTFFVAAAQSYRHDSVAKPFPNYPTSGKQLEIETIREIIAKVPPFDELLHKLKANQPIDEDVVHLLHWILVRVRDPYLKSVIRSDVSSFH